jgi:4-amino-4-deoxy-L-arabinose transferase-like glycosyltransferase
MVQTHDWVTPRLWGAPWFEKPVLYYWAAGMAMRFFGAGEFAARLPSALAALLAVVAVAWTALRSYGVGAAWYTLLMLPTCAAMIGFSRAAGPDMLFAALLTAAMAVCSEILQKPRPGPPLRVAFGFFLGAAVLAKGPAAIILAGGATLLWAALSREWRAPFRFLHPLIIAAFCATALPWYALCALRNPDFLRDFVWKHNFERYLTPLFEHRQPFWFFGYVVLLAVIPWIGSLVTLRWRIRPNKDRMDSPGLLFGCWAAFTVLFFSLSQSKLPGYILPAIPPLFVLLGHGMDRSFREARRSALWQTGAIGLLFVAFATPLFKLVMETETVRRLQISNPRVVLAAMILTMAGGLGIIALSWLKRPRAAFIGAVLLTSSLVEIAIVGILPQIDRHLSSRELARTILSNGPPMPNVSEYELPRAWNYGLNYYLGQELKEWTPGSRQPDWIVTTSAAALEIQDQDVQIREVNSNSASKIVLLRVAGKEDQRNPR